MIARIRLFLLAAAVCFAVAAVLHAGYYEHRPTGIAEAIMALLLLAGAVASWLRPALTWGLSYTARPLP